MLSKIPAESPSFRARTASPVSDDWMVGTIWTKLPAPHSVIEPVSQLKRILAVYLNLTFGMAAGCKWGTLFAISMDVGDHAFLKCNLLNLARHLTQIHQYAINLGHPYQRVLIQ